MKKFSTAAFTAPTPLLKKMRRKAKKLHGKRGFSKHVTKVMGEHGV